MVHQQQPSLQQMKALAIVPKISGSLSLLGSLFVLQDILRNKKKRGESVYHKIMLGLSLFDAMSSAANIFSTWPSPSNSSIYGALGTTATCTAQGFFNEMGNLTTTLYVASLCVRYLLVVKYNWRESQLQKYEALFHLIPIAIGCTMSTIGLPLNLYNNAGWICWYATYPHGCTVDHSCTRGELANTFRWIHYGFLWSAIIFVTVSMILIYLKVKDQEQKAQYLRDQTDASTRRHAVVDTSESTMRKVSKRLSFTNLAMGESASELRQARKRTTNAKKVAVQASLYVGALYLTWIFATVCTKSTRQLSISCLNQIPFVILLFNISQSYLTCLTTELTSPDFPFSARALLLTADEDIANYPKRVILQSVITDGNILSTTGCIQCFYLREATVSQA